MSRSQQMNSFHIIEEQPINLVARQRLLQRQQFAQYNQITGGSKAIIMSDGQNNRVKIGFAG